MINYGLFLAFAIVSAGLIAQIKKIISLKTTKDISVLDVICRMLATIIFFIKLIQVGDRYLIIGHIFTSIIMIFYTITFFVIRIKYEKENLKN